jgi:hypothetical protein
LNCSRRNGFATIVAASLCVAIPSVAGSLPARQSSAPPVVKQEVPDNLLHPAAPEQPIPYSHKTHLAVGLTCQVCHTNPEPGKLMTFPVTSKCMQCHAAVAADKPAIQKLASFAKSGATIPWVRVYSVTSGVNWSHRKHLDAGMKCQMCHGDVAQMSTMSEATSVMAMGVCISCHEAHKAPVVCSTCQSWPSH